MRPFTLVKLFLLVGYISASQVWAEEYSGLPADLSTQINKIEKQFEQSKTKTEFQTLKTDLDKILEQLKTCEKKSATEIKELAELRAPTAQADIATTPNTPATEPEGKSKALKTIEVKLQDKHIECKYYSLRASQLKDKLLKKVSDERLFNYFSQTDLYWVDAVESPYQWGSEATLMLYSYFAVYLFVLTLLLLFSTARAPLWELVDYRAFLALISCLLAAYATIAARTHIELLEFDSNWLFWSSILLVPRFLSADSFWLKLIFSMAAGLGLASTVLILDGVIWESGKYLHGFIILSSLISLYCMVFFHKSISHWPLTLLTVVIIACEAAEYHAAAHQLILLIFVLLILRSLHKIIIMHFKLLDVFCEQAKITWLVRLRGYFGYKHKVSIPGVDWLRWSVYLSIMISSTLTLLRYSGLPESLMDTFQSSFIDGFKVGTVDLNPQNLLVAAAIFGLILFLAWLVRQRIEIKSIKKRVSERGSDTAKAVLFWYSAVVTAFLTSLSVSGFGFENLAMIAGAFSVGIGFGLQNIVSNFVSGIILLIERPVKQGDWVIIGGTEGFVQNINIRATQIRTFDNSDILVPNSEFISNQVTNLMLRDQIGRLKIDVGVAYGSDTNKVLEVLNEIIRQQDCVIQDNPELSPSVIFTQFGDSSLNFQVRAFIDDIKRIYAVRSDILLAVDAAFRQHQIEIPFPQRDLHIKSDVRTNLQPDNNKELRPQTKSNNNNNNNNNKNDNSNSPGENNDE